MKDSLNTNDPRVNIEQDLNGFEKLLRRIPGFKGYLELRDRREADQLLRENISAGLEETRLAYSTVHEALASDIIKAIDFAEPMGRVDNRLMGLISKIKDAPQGYSGFFDAVKVDAEVLDQLYNFDYSMVAHAEEIKTQVEGLKSAVDMDSDIKAAIRSLDQAILAANDTFISRNEILTKMA